MSIQVPHVDSILDNPLYIKACGKKRKRDDDTEEMEVEDDSSYSTDGSVEADESE